MDTEKKQILLLAGLTIVIVGLAFFSVRWMNRDASSGTSSATPTPAAESTNAAATQQAKEVTALQTATSFIWKDYIHLSVAPYTRTEFYMYRDGKSTKLTSKNGTLSDVVVTKGSVFFIVDEKRLFQYSPATGAETSIVDGSKKITNVAISPDGTKIAFTESLIEAESETVTVKLWDKSRRTLSDLGTIDPDGIYFVFNRMVWSQTYNKLFVVGGGGDGGYAVSVIYEVDQATKQISQVKKYEIGGSTGAIINAFDAQGDTVFISEITETDADAVTGTTIKQINLSSLQEQVLYTFPDAKSIGAQTFAVGPKGTPVIMGNVDVNSEGLTAAALGFFKVADESLTRLAPGGVTKWVGAENWAHVLGVNDASYIYGVQVDGAYRLYMASLTSNQVSLLHSFPVSGTGSQPISFGGWIK